MLKLIDIKKDYLSGQDTVKALKGVNLSFRKNEFTSILGPSGCGKTTLLNIIGGLDRYTKGDLNINGKSTKDFKDADWDAYRNKRIGFIFQSYQLIPHLSVQKNVELALTLSGVSASERRERAIKALIEVGLGDKLKKKPNQLSGGQMQRVSIARALINNPEIILADEPTGALDSATSEQIMRTLASIAKDKLVIMVTHNEKLAKRYSTRIISLLDGEVVGDTAPYVAKATKIADNELLKNTTFATQAIPNKHKESKDKNKDKNKDKTSMSFITAINLSFRNLLTKKVRTTITAIAGSIGIIGVGLVLAISNGFSLYLKDMEQGVLGTFPIMVSEISMEPSSLMTMNPMALLQASDDPNLEAFTKNGIIIPKKTTLSQDMMEMMEDMIIFNNITDDYIEHVGALDKNLGATQYAYSLQMNLLSRISGGGYEFLDNAQISWQHIMGDKDFILQQYEIIEGTYPDPNKPYQVVVIVDKYNRVEQEVIKALGLNMDEPISTSDLLQSNIKLVYNDAYYLENTNNGYYQSFKAVYDKAGSVAKQQAYEQLYNNTEQTRALEVVGVMRVREGIDFELMLNGIGYPSELVEDVLAIEQNSKVAKAQQLSQNKNIDVTTGKKFSVNIDFNTIMSLDINAYIKMAGQFYNANNNEYMLNSKLRELGGSNTPATIYVYPKDFKSKAAIKSYLNEYNQNLLREEDKVVSIDMAQAATGMAESIINIVSIVLVCFAAISLVVSSIMISIITYVSVVERTKEIGILRSIGARKLDISNVFNAETTIIGFISGTIGVIVTYFLSVPINLIIQKYAGFTANIARLNPLYALSLIIISIVLTFVAGLIPSGIAARKDPVVALRTE